MKKSPQAMLGVTLLEIMLVLAIAAMVVVMSIRYYQSASNNQKITAALNAITAIVAGGESALAAKGTLATAAADIPPYLPSGVLPSSPWGGTITLTNGSANSYTININNVSASACTPLKNLIAQNAKLNSSTTCPGSGTVTLAVVVTE